MSQSPYEKENHSGDQSDNAQMQCISCNGRLITHKGVRICPRCNSDQIEVSQLFTEAQANDDYIYIECQGATLYDPETGEIVEGVKFLDDDDPSKGYKIINQPVYPPTHTKRRRIKPEAVGRIRRCQACQDYTVRMRRREGPDFFIPSHKHPKRKKLKTVTHYSR